MPTVIPSLYGKPLVSVHFARFEFGDFTALPRSLDVPAIYLGCASNLQHSPTVLVWNFVMLRSRGCQRITGLVNRREV